MRRFVGTALALVGAIGVFMQLFNPSFPQFADVPLWVAARVPDKLGHLPPGIPLNKAIEDLGLKGYSVGPMLGEGPFNAYSLSYHLRARQTMWFVVDCTQKPDKFRYGEVYGTDWSPLWAVVMLCVALSGVRLLRHRDKPTGDGKAPSTA